MMHFIRENFATLLDTPGLISSVMLSTFYPTHSLYDDIVKQDIESEFISYINAVINKEINSLVDTGKSPVELMDERGYTLKECKTESDIQEYKKYYKEKEQLCTFNGGRLDKARVFFAVKKNVNEIIRENFKNPEREDEYGTSVISIQFSKNGSNTLSIKNRYNHRVSNPDATFSNNLDNIIQGLTKSFEDYYCIIQRGIDRHFNLRGYVKAVDGKFYKYNSEINNIYFCVDNIIIDNFVSKQYNKSEVLVLEYFIINFKEKKFYCYEYFNDELVTKLGKIDNIERTKDKVVLMSSNRSVVIYFDEFYRITKIICNNLNNLTNEFLKETKYINYLEINGCTKVGKNFLLGTKTKSINMPDLVIASKNFCRSTSIKSVNLPSIKVVGDEFLASTRIEKLILPNLVRCGTYFLYDASDLKNVYLPKLKVCKESFLSNTSISNIKLPSLVVSSKRFLYYNKSLKSVYLPKLEISGEYFLYGCCCLEKIICPKLKEVGDNSLTSYSELREVYMPSLRSVGCNFDIEPVENTLVNLESLQYFYTNFYNMGAYTNDYIKHNIELELISRGYSRKLKR